MRRERAVMLLVLTAAGVACVLGAADPAQVGEGDLGQELLDLVRIGCTAALAISLLLGPGILLRSASQRTISLGFLFLPGFALLVAAGGLAWLLADSVDPKVVCFAFVTPVLGLLFGALLGAGPDDLLDPEEQRTLLLVSIVLGIAIGRSIWSLSVAGELYEGTISRTLVPEGRPDSRISYFIPQLIAHGQSPYSNDASYLYAPYNFSSRGPFPGLGSSPIVFLTGGRPELGAPEAPWRPFDPQGFMAYRVAMMTFSCTVLLSLWELVRRIGGNTAARLALLLGVSTPFVYADLWFTWPKLLGAAFVLLSGLLILQRRSFRSGFTLGAGYLMHPSALLGISAVGLLSLWPARPPELRWPRWARPDLRSALGLLAGAGICMLAWRLVNGSHYLQGPFFEYVSQAYPNYHPAPGEWIHFRLASLGNTVVPLFLPIFYGHNISINTFGGISPGVVHFFFQYWNGVPFGLGIFFFPLLLVSLWRALRRRPWPVLATVVIPFAIFIVYWGASITGILREGLQWWPFAVLAVIALQQRDAGFNWLRSRLVRAILALRAVEVLAVAIGPVLGTHGFRALNPSLTLNDLVAFGGIVLLGVVLVAVVWSETARLGRIGEQAGAHEAGRLGADG